MCSYTVQYILTFPMHVHVHVYIVLLVKSVSIVFACITYTAHTCTLAVYHITYSIHVWCTAHR